MSTGLLTTRYAPMPNASLLCGFFAVGQIDPRNQL
jgi:hypothetical protein